MTQETARIYCELTPELQQLLSENGLSIGEILHQENIESDVTYGVVPDMEDLGSRSKDPALIILASATLVLAIGAAISRVLSTLQRRPQLVEYFEFHELRDANGDVLRNESGMPRLKRVKKYEFIEPRKQDSTQTLEISSHPSNGLVMRFGATDRQIGAPEILPPG